MAPRRACWQTLNKFNVVSIAALHRLPREQVKSMSFLYEHMSNVGAEQLMRVRYEAIRG